MDIVPVQQAKCNPLVACGYPGSTFHISWVNCLSSAPFTYYRWARLSSRNLLIAIHAEYVAAFNRDKRQCAHSLNPQQDTP